MLKNFFGSAFRNLWHQRLLSLINVTSLALGLCVFAFAFLYVKKELSYDRAWPEAERIHRLVIEQRGLPGMPDGRFHIGNARIFPALMNYFPEQIDKASRLISSPIRMADSDFDGYIPLDLVDPDFASIFQLEVSAGDLGQVLRTPGLIAIEENLAERLVGNEPLGKRLAFEGFNGSGQEYEVGAVFRLPALVSVRFQLLARISDHASPLLFQNIDDMSSQIWLTFAEGVDARAFNARQPAFIDRTVEAFNDSLPVGVSISERLSYNFQPAAEMHFNPVDTEGRFSAGDPAKVATIAAVGLLVLLAGCSNSISLSLAGVLERRREIGIRKTAGALKGDIMRQYLGEAVLVALLACGVAMIAQASLTPAVAPLMSIGAPPEAGIVEYAILAGIAVLVGLGNGLYPAVVLSGVRPQAVLKANAAGRLKGTQRLRALLVGVQFSLALILLISTLSLNRQLTVTREQPIGFDPDNLIFLSSGLPGGQSEPLRNALRAVPGATHVTPAGMLPNTNFPLAANSAGLVRRGPGGEEIKAYRVPVGIGHFETTAIPLLAGRAFDSVRDRRYDNGRYAEQESEETPIGNRVMLNRSAVRELGFAGPEQAAGEIIHQRVTDQSGNTFNTPTAIIGVVEDSMYSSLHRRPGPEIYLHLNSSTNLMLKYDESAAESIQQRIRETWRDVTGTDLQNMLFIEQQMEAAFLQERNESRLLLICAGLALFLSCIGLYGLAAFAMERNVKEVGVRKVLGAGAGRIVSLFLWRFSKPVLLANIVAWPVASWFVLRWIEQFPYQMEKAWLLPICVGAALAVLAIAMLTVSAITARAALTKPVQSLRYE